MDPVTIQVDNLFDQIFEKTSHIVTQSKKHFSENKLALKVPKNTTVDVAAQNLAEQVKVNNLEEKSIEMSCLFFFSLSHFQIFILQYGVELVDNEPEINQGVKSK